jgi:hypothetical protein
VREHRVRAARGGVIVNSTAFQLLACVGPFILAAAVYHAIRRWQSRKDREMQLALADMHEFAPDPSTQPFQALTCTCGQVWNHHVHTGDRQKCPCDECGTWNGAGKFSARNEAA